MKFPIEPTLEVPERIELQATALEERDFIIARSQELQAVTNAEEQEVAASEGRAIAEHIKEVKLARHALAQPLLKLQDQLINAEGKYCGPLIAEKERLAGLITAFQLAEVDRVKAEEIQRQREYEELEAQRVAAETKAREVDDPQAQVEAEQEAHQAQEAARAVITAPLPKAHKAPGSVMRREMCYEVVDLKKIYASKPELCKLAISAAAVKALVFPGDNATEQHPDMSVPGLKLWWKDRTIFRSR